MTAQVHLAHPALAAGGNAKGDAFVGAQCLPAFLQRGDAEGVVREGSQPAGQGALVEQPVADAGGRRGVELGGGQPAGRMGKGGVGHGREAWAVEDGADYHGPCLSAASCPQADEAVQSGPEPTASAQQRQQVENA
ncbi:hypothetical protein D3C85_988370 [compost metagenome]